jgi:hypothetical protein
MLARELERECNHDDVSKVCHSVDTKLGSFSFIQQYLNNWLVCSYHYQIEVHLSLKWHCVWLRDYSVWYTVSTRTHNLHS